MNPEIQYIHTQIQANNIIIGHLQRDMAHLSQLRQEKSHFINELMGQNTQLSEKLDAMNVSGQSLVTYHPTFD